MLCLRCFQENFSRISNKSVCVALIFSCVHSFVPFHFALRCNDWFANFLSTLKIFEATDIVYLTTAVIAIRTRKRVLSCHHEHSNFSVHIH